MEQLKSEIIAIGTELLLGQIANTNAQWLSKQMASYGINTYYHTVVGDNLYRVEEVFKHAQERSDVMIVSGGLGPTEDDMTREAFQRITKLEMIEHPPAIEKIELFYQKQQTKMTPNNRRQARVFAGAEVISNKLGMAPGMIVSYEGKTWIFIPGVPREMKQMATDHVFPYILEKYGQKMIIQSKTLRFTGIGESRLEHELQDIIHNQNNPTIAPLAQDDGVVIRLTAKEMTKEKANELIEKTEQRILARVGNYLYGIDNETITEKIYNMLKEQNKRVAAAESLTGGMFIEKLISLEGASQVCPGGLVCYDTSVKENILKVSPQTVENYGVVSHECAIEMATNIRCLLDTNIGIGFTGVAGPTSIEDQPVGTVYIAISSDTGHEEVQKFIFQGDRDTIRHKVTIKGFEILFNYLKRVNESSFFIDNE